MRREVVGAGKEACVKNSKCTIGPFCLYTGAYCETADLRNKKLLLAELQCFNTDSLLCDNYSLVDQKYHHLRLETAKKLKVKHPLPLPPSHCNQDKENSLRKSAIFLLHSLSWYLRVYCTALEPCFIFRLQITGPFATMSKMSKQRRLVENHRLS